MSAFYDRLYWTLLLSSSPRHWQSNQNSGNNGAGLRNGGSDTIWDLLLGRKNPESPQHVFCQVPRHVQKSWTKSPQLKNRSSVPRELERLDSKGTATAQHLRWHRLRATNWVRGCRGLGGIWAWPRTPQPFPQHDGIFGWSAWWLLGVKHCLVHCCAASFEKKLSICLKMHLTRVLSWRSGRQSGFQH